MHVFSFPQFTEVMLKSLFHACIPLLPQTWKKKKQNNISSKDSNSFPWKNIFKDQSLGTLGVCLLLGCHCFWTFRWKDLGRTQFLQENMYFSFRGSSRPEGLSSEISLLSERVEGYATEEDIFRTWDMDMEHRTTFAFTNSCSWDYMHKTYTRLGPSAFHHGWRRGYLAPSLPQSLLTNNGCSKKRWYSQW